MASLLDSIFGFFDSISAWYTNWQVQASIGNMQQISGSDGLNSYVSALDPGIAADPRVQAAIADTKARVGSQEDLGPFGSIAKAIVGGFDALEGDIGIAIADLLSANLTGDKSGIGTAIGEALDPVLQMMVTAMSGKGKQVPADTVAQLKGALVPIIQLGLTLEIASDLAEFAMPTKTLGTGGIGHFIHDTIGFSALCDAYTGPVRQALIEIPVRYDIMRVIQPWRVRPQEMVKLVYWGKATPDEYAEELRYTGIQETQIPDLEATIWQALGMRNLQRMTTVGLPDITWLQDRKSVV